MNEEVKQEEKKVTPFSFIMHSDNKSLGSSLLAKAEEKRTEEHTNAATFAVKEVVKRLEEIEHARSRLDFMFNFFSARKLAIEEGKFRYIESKRDIRYDEDVLNRDPSALYEGQAY